MLDPNPTIWECHVLCVAFMKSVTYLDEMRTFFVSYVHLIVLRHFVHFFLQWTGRTVLLLQGKRIDPNYKEIRSKNHTISDACRLGTDQPLPYPYYIPIKVILGSRFTRHIATLDPHDPMTISNTKHQN